MEVVSPGANGHAPSSSSVTTIDPDLVIRHLVDLLEVTLGASTEDLQSSGSLLSASKRHDTVQRCTRFASESQVAIYVQKDAVITESIEGAFHGSSGKQRHTQGSESYTDFWSQEMFTTMPTNYRPRYHIRPLQLPLWH